MKTIYFNNRDHLKKGLTLLLACLCISLTSSAQGKLEISTGAYLNVNGNANITLDNSRLVNNGTLDAGVSTIKINGNALAVQSAIEGSSAIVVENLSVDKSANELLLNTDITVNGDLTFINGNLELNSKVLTLGNSASIVGESETSRITGIGGGEVVISASLNMPAAVNPGNIGAEISSSQNLGLTTITRGHVAQTHGGNAGIYRYYEIDPANNTGLNATLRFHYMDAELNGLSESLTLWRYNDATMRWDEIGMDNNNMTNNWIEKNSVDHFSLWTAAEAGTLPVELFSFTGDCDEGAVLLRWVTASEIDNEKFVLERSADANRWEEIATIEGSGTSQTFMQYSYKDQSPLQLRSYYRLAQYDFDGTRSYSDIVSTECHSLDKGWSVNPNLIHHSDGAVQIVFSQAPRKGKIVMYDQIGIRISEMDLGEYAGAQLIQYSFEKDLPSGIYYLRLEDSGIDLGPKRIVVQQ